MNHILLPPLQRALLDIRKNVDDISYKEVLVVCDEPLLVSLAVPDYQVLLLKLK